MSDGNNYVDDDDDEYLSESSDVIQEKPPLTPNQILELKKQSMDIKEELKRIDKEFAAKQMALNDKLHDMEEKFWCWNVQVGRNSSYNLFSSKAKAYEYIKQLKDAGIRKKIKLKQSFNGPQEYPEIIDNPDQLDYIDEINK